MAKKEIIKSVSKKVAEPKKPASEVVVALKAVLKETQLEKSKATRIAAEYGPAMRELEAEAAKLEGLNVKLEEDVKIAKRVRIDTGKICVRLEKLKAEGKAEIRVEDSFINAVFNTIAGFGRHTQEQAKQIETFEAQIAMEKAQQTALKRQQQMAQYDVPEIIPGLGEMHDSVFDSLLEGAKKKFKEAQEHKLSKAAEAAEAAEAEALKKSREESKAFQLAAEEAEERINKLSKKLEQQEATEVAKKAEVAAQAAKDAKEQSLAAAQPEKERLKLWIKNATLGQPPVQNSVTGDIELYFAKFKLWATKQIDSKL